MEQNRRPVRNTHKRIDWACDDRSSFHQTSRNRIDGLPRSRTRKTRIRHGKMHPRTRDPHHRLHQIQRSDGNGHEKNVGNDHEQRQRVRLQVQVRKASFATSPKR